MKTFRTYEELRSFLENWTNFKSDVMYDFTGMACILDACLDNLRKNALEVDLERIPLSKENVEYMSKLVEFAKQYPAEQED